MMNQETYVKLEDLHKQGWTIKEIAAETGYHPATAAKRLREGPPPLRRGMSDEARVMNRRWAERIEALVGAYPRLLGVSVFRCLQAEGFGGCYSTVTRELRRIRGPRFSAADRVSVPIHTDPGEEAQFDWCNLDAVARRWGWGGPLRCFGMILCWSRRRLWWFCASEDRSCTFEAMVRFFEAVGGVPAMCRTDRMGALGSSQGARFVLHAAATGFAAHHSTRIASCRPGPMLHQHACRPEGLSDAPLSSGECESGVSGGFVAPHSADKRPRCSATKRTWRTPTRRCRATRRRTLTGPACTRTGGSPLWAGSSRADGHRTMPCAAAPTRRSCRHLPPAAATRPPPAAVTRLSS